MSHIDRMARLFILLSLSLISTGTLDAFAQPTEGSAPVAESESSEASAGSDLAVLPLTEDDINLLRAQRGFIERYMTVEETKAYDSADGKLQLISRLLEKAEFLPEDTWELQCLGVILGDALAMHPRLEWVAFEDEYGRDAALHVADTTIVMFPITMISKRIERGEQVDALLLYDGILAELDRVLKSGEYQ